MDDHIRKTALARLHMGATPTECSEAMPGQVGYSQALKMKKELLDAGDDYLSVFEMDGPSVAVLCDAVGKQVAPLLDGWGIDKTLSGEVADVKALVGLAGDFEAAGSALANKIVLAATISNNADTVLSLAKALSELQVAFFGPGGGGSGGGGGDGDEPFDFEKYLTK